VKPGFSLGGRVPHFQSALGIGAILCAAWALSEDRRTFRWRMVAGTLLLQAVIALLLLRVPFMRNALYSLNSVVDALTTATHAGTGFIFGYMGGGPAPFAVTNPGAMINLAFTILPLVMVIGALSAMLWHWRVLPIIVNAMALVLKKTLGLGGAIGLGSASIVFLGNIEGQLVIRPYLARLNRTELFILMTVGMSVIAGTVFVLYATILKGVLPGALGHLLVASMMSLPAGILVARIMVPGSADTDISEEQGSVHYRSTMDAMAQGTEDGLKIYLQIIAMLIVTTSLVALANVVLAVLPGMGGTPLTLERMLGWGFAPFVWLLGVPTEQAGAAGGLMGIKVILNELLAYLHMAAMPKGALDPRSTQIMVYAMCGFANFGSVGILIAGMSALIPERRGEVVSLAFRALVAGTLASGLTGAMIGLLPV
jgi:CNT family concentrative nucleoside transporter